LEFPPEAALRAFARQRLRLGIEPAAAGLDRDGVLLDGDVEVLRGHAGHVEIDHHHPLVPGKQPLERP
jgi:hypothetical protein